MDNLKKEAGNSKAELLAERYDRVIGTALEIYAPYGELHNLIVNAATSNGWFERMEWLDQIELWLNNYCNPAEVNRRAK